MRGKGGVAGERGWGKSNSGDNQSPFGLKGIHS